MLKKKFIQKLLQQYFKDLNYKDIFCSTVELFKALFVYKLRFKTKLNWAISIH